MEFEIVMVQVKFRPEQLAHHLDRVAAHVESAAFERTIWTEGRQHEIATGR